MSVISFSDSPARGGGWTSERKGPIFELVNRRYKRTIVAITSDVSDGPETVLATPGMPTLGSSYALGNDLDSIAVCIDVQAEPISDYPNAWKVTAQYDSSRVVDIALSNPLNLPAEITWNFTKYEMPLQRDALGIPLVNSSGERFDPPLTTEVSRPILRVSRNEVGYNEANALLYQDAVNTDTFGPAAPLQAKVGNITGQRMVDIGIEYWKVDYEIEFQWLTFALFVLDQGFRDFDGRLLRDPVDNSPLANASLLNGRGYRVSSTYCQLSSNIAATDVQLTVKNPPQYTQSGQPHDYFPPGPVAGTSSWYFEIKIDTEIMQVQGGFGTNTWNVVRGYAGTTPASHASNAYVYLQPYFLRFIPFKTLPFAPLNLPTS